MNGEESPTGHIRDEPDDRWRHYFRLDHGGASKARFVAVLVIPPGTKTLTVTPVPSRSFQLHWVCGLDTDPTLTLCGCFHLTT
jgi:hypothetical protein